MRAFGVIGVVCAVAAYACSSVTNDAAPKACAPGQSIACAGPAQCAGTQVCKPDGSAFDVCSCGNGTTATSASGTATTGGAGGTLAASAAGSGGATNTSSSTVASA